MYSFAGRVRYSEADADQNLTLTGIINYFQDCSTFQSEDLHQGIRYLAARQRAWWLSSWQIVIRRYPKFGEEIVVSTWPYDFKGIYGYRNFTIQDQSGAYLVKANSVWFLYDTAAGRPVRISEEDVRAYGTGSEEKLDMDYAPRRIVLPDEYEEAAPVTAALHHIDTNRHVNNAQYVEIAREALSGSGRVRELRVEYKKAAVLGDVICPRIAWKDGVCTVALCSEEGQPYAVVWMKPE